MRWLAVLFLPLVVVLSARADASHAADTQCWEDWSRATAIVQEHRLASAPEVRDFALARTPGQLLKMTLCKRGDGFVYKLSILRDAGRIANVTVDAEPPLGR